MERGKVVLLDEVRLRRVLEGRVKIKDSGVQLLNDLEKDLVDSLTDAVREIVPDGETATGEDWEEFRDGLMEMLEDGVLHEVFSRHEEWDEPFQCMLIGCLMTAFMGGRLDFSNEDQLKQAIECALFYAINSIVLIGTTVGLGGE